MDLHAEEPRHPSFLVREIRRLKSSDYQTCAVITNPHIPDNPIVYATPAFFSFTGYAPDEVLGRNCRFLQGPETDRRLVDALRDALQAELEIRTELLNYTRDGIPFRNRLYVKPLYDQDGNLVRFAGYQTPLGDRAQEPLTHFG